MKKEDQKIHIGNAIREQLEKSGMTKSELARRIETSPQNIFGIFRRETIDTGTLQIIGKVLNYDFFRLYNFEAPPESTTSAEFNRISKLSSDLSIENELLKEMYQMQKEKIAQQESDKLQLTEALRKLCADEHITDEQYSYFIRNGKEAIEKHGSK